MKRISYTGTAVALFSGEGVEVCFYLRVGFMSAQLIHLPLPSTSSRNVEYTMHVGYASPYCQHHPLAHPQEQRKLSNRYSVPVPDCERLISPQNVMLAGTRTQTPTAPTRPREETELCTTTNTPPQALPPTPQLAIPSNLDALGLGQRGSLGSLLESQLL